MADAGSSSGGAKFPEGVVAYVDGSYDAASGRFSCGVVIIETDADGNSETTELKSAFDDVEAAAQRNVAGEIMGSKLAIDWCMANGVKSVEIYHDYEGIGAWADRRWKANNPLTQGYRDFVAEARKSIDITFVKVKAHAGNKYNELADKLAKKALSE
jgi:ribonuclease HI